MKLHETIEPEYWDLYEEIERLKQYEPKSAHVTRAYCDCCAAPVPFDHVCSCETLIDETINGE